MPIFKSRYFNELQVNGQEVADTDTSPNADYTADANDGNSAQEPRDIQANQPMADPTQAPDDYMIPDAGEGQNSPQGDPIPPGAPDMGNDPNMAGDMGEDMADYTQGDGEFDVNSSDMSTAKEMPEDEKEIRALEDELFATFNDKQIAIMTKRLKANYFKIYDMLDTLIERINDIPKEHEVIEIIAFVTDKLSDMRDMLDDYMTDSFNSNTYVQNQINYKRFILTLRQINGTLATLYPKEKDAKNVKKPLES